MKAMTSRERMLTALEGGIPDRVPATVHQWQPYHLNKYLGGISDLEAFRMFGLDASIPCFPISGTETSDWKISWTDLPAPEGETRMEMLITTPEGTLSQEVGQNEVTSWRTTPLVKNKEDIELIRKYLPVPKLDKEAVKGALDWIGDSGILRGFIMGYQGGCWQDAVNLVGTSELILEAADNPEWVHELLGILLQKKLQFIEDNMDGAAFDLIETGGGASSSTVISPKYFKEFCLPYDRQLHDALKSRGHKVVYHTCGGMMPILELIVETNCDAAETLTLPSMGGDARPAELKSRIGDKVVLIGGLDQNSVLEKGDGPDIQKHIHEMFDAYGTNGGYIMSPSDHFFHIPSDNLRHYADAARSCTYADTSINTGLASSVK